MGRLDGKRAMVTGAARGTGESIARRFVAEGARVVCGDVLDEPAMAVAKDLGAAAAYQHLDVTSEADWERGVAFCQEELGGLDILVNNAAILLMKPMAETSLAEYERVVSVNQTGVFLGMRIASEALRKAGGGSIVNIASIDGTRGTTRLIAYASSKWAVRGMTRVAALELGRHGIRVNAICPEAGSPHMVAPYVPDGVDMERAMAAQMPVLPPQKDRTVAERLDDIAQLSVFLASDESTSCTGADFVIDGGNTAGRILPEMPER